MLKSYCILVNLLCLVDVYILNNLILESKLFEHCFDLKLFDFYLCMT